MGKRWSLRRRRQSKSGERGYVMVKLGWRPLKGYRQVDRGGKDRLPGNDSRRFLYRPLPPAHSRHSFPPGSDPMPFAAPLIQNLSHHIATSYLSRASQFNLLQITLLANTSIQTVTHRYASLLCYSTHVRTPGPWYSAVQLQYCTAASSAVQT